jgi:hypothetical protein
MAGIKVGCPVRGGVQAGHVGTPEYCCNFTAPAFEKQGWYGL